MLITTTWKLLNSQCGPLKVVKNRAAGLKNTSLKHRQAPHALNYNIRVLGRKGVLVLNAVAGMNQIDAIKGEMKIVVALTDFTAGNGYKDFDVSTDKVAEYGLAALVTGGVAAKLGFFGKIFAFLLLFKKLLLICLAAAGAGFYKLIGRNKKEEKNEQV
jgi:uncharacterized membrane-anchored protein